MKQNQYQKHKQNQKASITQVVFVLDRSGSMTSMASDTIGGFNSMLEEQKSIPGKCSVTTVLFDSVIEFLHQEEDIQSIPWMDSRTYRPGGLTALYDAIGLAIDHSVRVQRNLPAWKRADHVLFVIITDGLDNQSCRYTAAQIRHKIALEEEYGWEFMFLGANIDAAAAAQHVGITANRAAQFRPEAESARANFEIISEVLVQGRTTDCFAVPAAAAQITSMNETRQTGRSPRPPRIRPSETDDQDTEEVCRPLHKPHVPRRRRR